MISSIESQKSQGNEFALYCDNDLKQIINEIIKESQFVVSKETIKEIYNKTNITQEKLIEIFIEKAKTFSSPKISEYRVGAVGVDSCGNYYLGCNIEFIGSTLDQTIHGEQFVVINCLKNGANKLEAIFVSAPPCGYCRQFLNELEDGKNLTICFGDGSKKLLSHFLVNSFGPENLGMKGGLLTRSENNIVIQNSNDPLIKQAIEAARSSYAPYTNSFAGCAIQTNDNTIYSGGCIENAAYNPTISPFQAAAVDLISSGNLLINIKNVVLVEGKSSKVSYAAQIESILKTINKDISIIVINY